MAKVESKARACAGGADGRSSARCSSSGASRRRSRSGSAPGELPGFLHVAIGQEAVAVGVCRALEDGDVFASTHRAHGHTLARGHAPERADGGALRQGRGLLPRLRRLDAPLRRRAREPRRERRRRRRAARDHRRALAFKLRGEPRVAVAFFGDGATNIGTFHESLNLAQLWQVPAVFVLREQPLGRVDAGVAALPIEDLSSVRSRTACSRSRSTARTSRRSTSAAREALEHARSGKGPGLPARRDVPAHRPLRRRPAGLPRQGRVQRDARDAGSARPAAREARALRRGVRGARREVQEIVEASVEFAKSGHRPGARGRAEERLCLS